VYVCVCVCMCVCTRVRMCARERVCACVFCVYTHSRSLPLSRSLCLARACGQTHDVCCLDVCYMTHSSTRQSTQVFGSSSSSFSHTHSLSRSLTLFLSVSLSFTLFPPLFWRLEATDTAPFSLALKKMMNETHARAQDIEKRTHAQLVKKRRTHARLDTCD